MRRQLPVIILLLLSLGFPALGQKMDRGIDMSSQPTFISKGTWMVGGSASYTLQDSENANFLILNGINSTGYSISLTPAFCYMIQDNLGVGARVGYKRGMYHLDSAALILGDIADLQFSNYHKLSQSFEIQGIGRYYIPIGSLKRIGLFNEVQLAYSYGQGKVLDGRENAVNGSYEINNSLGLNVCPGFIAFITDNFAIDVNINMLGLQFDWTRQTHNQIETGSRQTSFINFKINLLAIGFSLYYYI